MASNEDDRTRDQSAVTVSADDYRMLFASIDEGYCIGELLFDAAGDPIDYLYLEANLSFRRLVRNDNPVGKTVTQLYSKIEANWLAVSADGRRH